jgi:hypothetical protein
MTKSANPDAAAAFNATWALIDKPDRTPAEDRQMLTLAHGSRHLWQTAGGLKECSIGDWQIARVYAILGQAALSRSFAQSALDLALAHATDPFLIAAAHEGVARALALTGDQAALVHAALARQLAQGLADVEDTQVIQLDPWIIARGDRIPGLSVV